MVDAFAPKTLAEGLKIRGEQSVIPFAGGTDLMVRRRSWSGTLPRFEQPTLFLGGIKELQSIDQTDSVLTIGAAATLTALLENALVPEILKKAVIEMASPAIRNAGTLGGNICNASPAGDTLPPLYALGATVVLRSAATRRELPVEEFILGPGKTALAGDELLVAVNIPTVDYNRVYYKKVGTRKADALSKVSFAGLAKVDGEIVKEVRLAVGAVAPRVVRCKEAENLLAGRSGGEIHGMIDNVMKIYAKEIRPIDDQRSSAEYRRTVALRLVEDYLTHRIG